MYPPIPPTDGMYRVKLLSLEQDDAAYYIRYDISVGSSVGWATYMYQQTGKWPLVWRLDKEKGSIAIRYALDALNHSAHANIESLTESTGHHMCLALQHRNYINVKRFYPLSACPYYMRTATKANLQWSIGVLSTILSYSPSAFLQAITQQVKMK